MDRISDSGSDDLGSNPGGVTGKQNPCNGIAGIFAFTGASGTLKSRRGWAPQFQPLRSQKKDFVPQNQLNKLVDL
jgi:hypothetical protein